MNNSINVLDPQDKTKEFRSLYNKLVSLLKEQINCVQQGDTQRLEQLGQKSGEYVEQIGMLKVLNKDDFVNELNELRGLYHHLCLSVSDQKEKTSDELSKIRKAKSTLGVYRESI